MNPLGPDSEDPFAGEDEASRERARRRAEREAKRRQRDNRASLGERVSGVIDGAASRGREKIEQTRERARSPEPPAEGVDPPSFRRPPPGSPERPDPAAVTRSAGGDQPPAGPVPPVGPEPDTIFRRPGDSAPDAARPRAREGVPSSAAEAGAARLSAEEAMPRRESLFRPRPVDTSEGDAIAPEPLAVPPARRPAGESEEWPATPPQRRRQPTTTSGGTLWRRRLFAVGAIVVLVVGAGLVLSKLRGGGEPAPTAPVAPIKTTNVTIPEGLTSDEIAKVAKDAGLKGDYAKAEQQAAKKFDVQKRGGPKGATLEGFLFPATYEVEKGADVADLVNKQLYEGFEPNFAEVDMSKAKKAGFSEFDVVTIASMIEREVQVPEEAPEVAAVIYNRIAQGIPLEIDATVRYAIGNDFSKALSTSDLAVDSPYNTYVNPGLPAGPISNPGLNSLQAAADPSGDNYLYYVVKPDTCPAEHFFTDDYDEFVAASQEYDAAQAAAGGKPNC